MATDDDIEREILAKGLTAARVTPESIEAKIKSEFYFTAADGVRGESQMGTRPAGNAESLERLTICILVLENGFTILGKSAPASVSNFDVGLGRKIARADAFNQIWPLEGYLLRENLFMDSLITTTQLVEDPLAELDKPLTPLELHGPTIDDIAKACHEANRAYCLAIGDNSQPAWADAPDWQKASAIAGVEFIQANPDASPSASHESWLEQKRVDGWKFGPVKDPEAKEHPCFVPYDELPTEQRAKDYIFGAIARSFLSPPAKPPLGATVGVE